MSNKQGKVYLVGAGPGDPGLLTLRGLECLQQAEFVLYDGLVNPILLRHTSADCERTSRMHGPDGRRLDQAEINARLIQEGKAGKVVVRLKGGDPFMFGRGSEEAAALRAEGIPFEVVPGITAATAAGVFAGISLTHRKLASCVAFVTGHEDPQKPESSLDYANLATFSGTLVFYMGLHRLPLITQSLIDHGKPTDAPACVISRASRSTQRTVYAPLADIASAVKQAALPAPSLIIVGDCVQQRESIAWFENRPLLGQRILITRPVDQTDASVRAVQQRGGQAVLQPMLSIQPVSVDSEILQRVGDFEWLIFTSANSVQHFFEQLFAAGIDARKLFRAQLAAVGPKTAAALGGYKLQADFVSVGQSAATLASEISSRVRSKKVLWPRGNRAHDALRETLQPVAGEFCEAVVYANNDVAANEISPRVIGQLEDGEIDWVTLTSPAIARRFAELCESETLDNAKFRIASMSDQISTAVRNAGLKVSAQAEETRFESILNAIQDHL